MIENRYRIARRVPSYAGGDYKNHARMAVREEAGRKLIELLEGQKLPTVVNFSEGWRDNLYGEFYEPEEVFEIDLRFTPVQHRHVTMAIPDYDSLAPFVDNSKVEKLKEYLAYMTLGFVSLFIIIVWFLSKV